ncbi:hypothetical protein CC78DRAFT_584272 [Lojkania enalia]|uniref:Uncharacterized protein n=1 Tax=Lojkania enalia TaxID=147567 RepID=A0A9P4MX35_9PLEO|nr:hypothetical protein CC78DRAFT_584272 [Didymosphaeria enalia]
MLAGVLQVPVDSRSGSGRQPDRGRDATEWLSHSITQHAIGNSATAARLAAPVPNEPWAIGAGAKRGFGWGSRSIHNVLTVLFLRPGQRRALSKSDDLGGERTTDIDIEAPPWTAIEFWHLGRRTHGTTTGTCLRVLVGGRYSQSGAAALASFGHPPHQTRRPRGPDHRTIRRTDDPLPGAARLARCFSVFPRPGHGHFSNSHLLFSVKVRRLLDRVQHPATLPNSPLPAAAGCLLASPSCYSVVE